MSKKLSRGLNRKQVGVVVAAFAFMLVGGVVYAATSGVMQINGTVARGVNVDLDFVNVACASANLEQAVDTPAGIRGVTLTGAAGGNYTCGTLLGNGAGTNGANDVFNWGAFLRSPGDSVTVNFSIENVGSVRADLVAISITDQTGLGSLTGQIRLEGTGTTIEQQFINPGVTIGPFAITVTWPNDEPTATGEGTFAATLQYTAAPLP
jgi:hypothetical protein